jgi:hypothetical protein
LKIIVVHQIVQLPNNYIPKGLVPLERLFDRNDVAVKGKISNDDVDVANCNIGTEKDPNLSNFQAACQRRRKSSMLDY